MKTGIELIAEERTRQIEVEGWDAEHDDGYVRDELSYAATAYVCPEYDRAVYWPFGFLWWKPSPHDRIKELSKAGALIAAEIDRIQRTQKSQ